MSVGTYRLLSHADAFKILYLWCLCQPSVQRIPTIHENRVCHIRTALGFDNDVPSSRVCPELHTLGLKYYQNTTWGQTANLAFPLLCTYFQSGPTDFFCTAQENNSVIVNKGWWLIPLRETSLSDVGLCNSLFELLSHSHKKASLTKAAESSEHLFRQQNWKTDFLSCVITHTHTHPAPESEFKSSSLTHIRNLQCRISERYQNPYRQT